jgi:hypothetical protein
MLHVRERRFGENTYLMSNRIDHIGDEDTPGGASVNAWDAGLTCIPASAQDD